MPDKIKKNPRNMNFCCILRRATVASHDIMSHGNFILKNWKKPEKTVEKFPKYFFFISQMCL